LQQPPNDERYHDAVPSRIISVLGASTGHANRAGILIPARSTDSMFQFTVTNRKLKVLSGAW
jgi:hypothetical protein